METIRGNWYVYKLDSGDGFTGSAYIQTQSYMLNMHISICKLSSVKIEKLLIMVEN